jgi:hypothetical protein
MDELPHWLQTRAERLHAPRPIRIDLRRSLEMHRWLVLGIALAGVALAAIYLLVFWPSAGTSVRSLNATGIVLIFCFLGAACAVTAHHLDQRIYIGADIEHLLGVAPLAELPDYAEAAPGMVQEHLGALVSAIAQACPEGRVTRCVLTGTGMGAGVTTVAARTREALKATGRAVMLVDVAWAPAGAGPGVEGATDESGSRGDCLILTDTAPLPESADTEFLARFADCVIVVVESGVTRRAQLRATADCLQGLNLAAVGFVVNRVRRAQNGWAHREWLKARESSTAGQSVGARKEFTAAVQRALASPPERTPPAATPPQAVAAELKRPKPEPTTALTIVKRPAPSSHWTAEGIPEWLSQALAELEARMPEIAVKSKPEAEAGSSASETADGAKTEDRGGQAGQKEKVTPDMRARGIASEKSEDGTMLFEMNWLEPRTGGEAAAQPGAVEERSAGDETAAKKPTRLSPLRGMVTAEGLRELSKSAHARGESDGLPEAVSDALKQAPARLGGLRGLVTPHDLQELSQTRQEPGPQAAVETKEIASQADEVNGGSGAAAQRSADQPAMPNAEQAQEAAAVEIAVDAKPKARARRADAASKPPVGDEGETREKYPEVQILPSKRGQYRRKKR